MGSQSISCRVVATYGNEKRLRITGLGHHLLNAEVFIESFQVPGNTGGTLDTSVQILLRTLWVTLLVLVHF